MAANDARIAKNVDREPKKRAAKIRYPRFSRMEEILNFLALRSAKRPPKVDVFGEDVKSRQDKTQKE